ncbi:MAG: DUF4298 domain-containing protein [Mogibacterium sp.]|nr:DUF4298 domain-containing protein [Mogibacterium sp.]
MSKAQTERIKKMESYLDEAGAVIAELDEAMDKYEKIQSKYYKLENYYGSTKWIDDYEADEAGKLPAELKRGVLSEDAVYDLITDHSALMARMQRAVLRSIENKGF